MKEISNIVKGFKTPESRWARFGPYYAMFPVDFAFEVVKKYSKSGDYILDPFAGRCTSLYAGGVMGRHSLGIEINPVGWLYGFVKMSPASKEDVLERLLEIYMKTDNYSYELEELPLFFKHCFCNEVLRFLMSCRKYLQWKNDSVDASLMSIILVYLHGKIGQSLSNKMPIAKSTGQNYSIKWWAKKNLLSPPEIDPYKFLKSRIEWRYAKGIPKIKDGDIIFGDSTQELKKIVKQSEKDGPKFSLLFTSPPYWSVTDYHADQWLRLWLLGGSPEIAPISGEYKGRFTSKKVYYQLLDNVFEQSSMIMADKSTVYVRTDTRKFTLQTTIKILNKHFPSYQMTKTPKPIKGRTQTEIGGNKSSKPGEIDIILTK